MTVSKSKNYLEGICIRMFKKAVQQGRSERKAEAYSFRYVEALSDVRTQLADFFNILPGVQK